MIARRHLLPALLAVALSLDAALPRESTGQAVPGTARGSQTGDGGSGYTGLASSPDANLFTGAAQASIPVEVPPGRLGLAPVLALSYSSSSGPGPVGYGWTLPLPRIHRSTRLGLPRYDDSDQFVLEMPDSASELERIPGSPRGFRARVEGAFLRIGFHDGDNTWKVIDKLGVSFTFGSTAMSRSGRGPSLRQTFAWHLDRIEDPAGNRIDFEYAPGGAGGTSNGLPAVIRYGANARAGAPHFASVTFTWAPLGRTGAPVVSWRNGFAESLDRRLASIETATHGLQARRYDFSHEEDPATGDLRLVGATLTARAADAADDVTLPSTVFVYADSMAAGWAATGSTTSSPAAFEVPAAGPLRIGERTVTAETLDLDGDAIVDRLDCTARPPRAMLGNGHGFGPPQAWNWPTGSGAPRSVRRSDSDGNLLSNVFDLDGDGFADLVDSSPAACGTTAGRWCVWRGSADGLASTPTTWPSPSTTLRQTEDGGSRIVADLVDMNADGRLDLVDTTPFDEAAGTKWWHVYRNDGTGFVATPVRFAAPVAWLARSDGARLAFGLFDLNADSLPDLVSADPDYGGGQVRWEGLLSWKVHFHQGDGFSAEPAEWPIAAGAATSLPNFVSLRATDGSTIGDLFDLTGDGRPDLVRRWRLSDPLGEGAVDRCDPSSRCPVPAPDATAESPSACCFDILVYANTGSSFAAPVAWSSPAHGLRSDHDSCPSGDSLSCLIPSLYDFDFFDFDGDGLVEFVERTTGTARPMSWIVHPHPAGAAGGRARPGLLLAMRNGVGGETMLRYSTAAAFGDSRVPFPHWIVRERELRDSVFDAAPLRTSFAYRGGFFDPGRRETRGFAVVQEVDPVGITRVREYHQDGRRAGRLRSMTSLEPAACTPTRPDDPEDPCSPWRRPLGRSDYSWPEEGPVLLASETDVPMHDGAPVENLRVTTGYRYDSWGNVTQRRSETPMARATTTVTQYSVRVSDRPGGMPDRYMVAKPSRVVTTEEGRPLPLVERTFEYEGATATPGVLSAAATCVDQAPGGCLRWSRRSFGYDPFGNLVVAHGPDGATSHTEYDGNALFAVRAIDPVGLVTGSTTDPRTGRVTETVTPNGNRLSSRHDGLGRLLRTWGPGSSEGDPRLRIDYAPGALGDSPPRASSHDPARGRSTVFFDGLGRRIATKNESESERTPVSVVSGLQLRDGRGLVIAEALPFDSPHLDVRELRESFGDAPAWIRFEYDSAGRRTATIAPDGTIRRVDSAAPGIVRSDDANIVSETRPGSVTLEIFDGWSRRILRDVCSARPTTASPYECPAGTLLRSESWRYDGLGRPEEIRTSGLGIAAGDAVTTIARDGLGNRIAVQGTNSGTWTYRNDESGRIVEVGKPDGSRILTSYDAAGRILRRRGPVTRASYRYHVAGGGIGKVKRVCTRTRASRVSEDYAYDDQGRVSGRRRRVAPRGLAPAEISVLYGYDRFDRRTETSVPDWGGDGVVHLEYDRFGREETLWTTESSFVAVAGRDSAGRTRRIDYGNGVSDLTSYDERSNAAGAAGHLRCRRTTVGAAPGAEACATSPQDLEALRHSAYDANGNLLAIDDVRFPAGDPRRDDLRLAYDALGRLSSAGTRTVVRERFAFDPLGNLTRNGDLEIRHDDPANPSRVTSSLASDGRVHTVEHDDNGRRIRDEDRTYGWDDGDRLLTVAVGGQVELEHGYADSGERLFTHDLVSGRWQFEMGDGIRLDGSVLERSLVFDGGVVAIDRRPIAEAFTDEPATRVYLHTDHQRSVRVVTDEAGRAVEYGRYRSFGGRRARLDGDGRPADTARTRVGYSGHLEDEDAGLLFFGARDYDPFTGSFLTLDPRSQFASPYAYSGGNPMAGRDADGTIFELTAMELLTIAVGTATFVDSIVRTGDLGHSLTAGVFAGFSVYASGQLSTAIARPLTQVAQPWMQMAASVASDGFQAIEAAEAIEDGRYAGGVVAAGMLAASLIGIETASDPGPGTSPEENYARHGIKDRGVVEGQRTIDVNGICSTRPGCFTNTLVAARENLRVLFGGKAACVGGCEHVAAITADRLGQGEDVRLRCNSFGAIKCLGAIQDGRFAANMGADAPAKLPRLSVEMSGAPLLRPPAMSGLTYQVNLFDPVVWVGTGWSTPLRSDVVLGRNWWVPAPVIVHHSGMYEKPFHEALGGMLP